VRPQHPTHRLLQRASRACKSTVPLPVCMPLDDNAQHPCTHGDAEGCARDMHGAVALTHVVLWPCSDVLYHMSSHGLLKTTITVHHAR